MQFIQPVDKGLGKFGGFSPDILDPELVSRHRGEAENSRLALCREEQVAGISQATVSRDIREIPEVGAFG